MDSRLRGNDGRGRSGRRRADRHSRFRGHDGTHAVDVIPAKAGVHTDFPEDECGVGWRRRPSADRARTGLRRWRALATSLALCPPAGALEPPGRRRADHHSRFRGHDGTHAVNVIPAKAGVHTDFPEDECGVGRRRRPTAARARTGLRRWLAFAATLALCAPAGAVEPLRLEEVAEGIHVYAGAHEEASAGNLGAVGNAGVVIGRDSVAVIDTGGSPEFGRRLRASIAALTDLPVAWVITTHAHPDHFFGHAAFDEDGASFAGHRKLARALAVRGPFYHDAFERLVGPAFDGARIVSPSVEVPDEIRIDLGDRVLALTAWGTAHTDNDLTVLDLRTGTLFAGDLVFIDRLPVVDGSLKGWLEVISELRRIPAARVVPGHGPAAAAWPEALDAQERYLRALLRDVRSEVAAGGRIEAAIGRVAPEERDRWMAFDLSHPRNVTASFTELEWE